jgi:cytochrome b subunit of formate dehydrogenase
MDSVKCFNGCDWGVSPTRATSTLILNFSNFTLFYPIDCLTMLEFVYVVIVVVVKIIMIFIIVSAFVSIILSITNLNFITLFVSIEMVRPFSQESIEF